MDNAAAAWLLSGVRLPRARALFMLAWTLALVAPLLVALVARPAWALDPSADDRARAAAALTQAEHDDEALDLERALLGYEEALRLDPSTSKAIRAEQRARSLRARSEGGFAPLVRLERVRRSPALASDATAIDELVRDADGFPPGLVRLEAWDLAAEAYAGRLGRPTDAIALWRRVIADPATDPVTVRAAIKSMTSLLLARGMIADAEAAITHPLADAQLVRDVHRVVRRHTLHTIAIAALALAFGLAATAVVRAGRAGRLRSVLAQTRAASRLVVVYATYVAVAGAALASGYEDGTSLPFLLLGVVLVPLLFIARTWGAAGSTARSARAFRAALCATSAVAAAFLVLERTDVTYLEGLGL